MLTLTVFDVGQAASAMVRSGNVYGIIDCGIDVNTRRNPIRDVLRAAIERDPDVVIAFLLLTHLDFDHVSGLEDLLTDHEIGVRIKNVLCNGPEFRALAHVAHRNLKGKSGSGASKGKRAPALRSLGKLVQFITGGIKDHRDLHTELVAPNRLYGEGYPVRLAIREFEQCEVWLFSPSQELKDGVLSRLAQIIDPDSDLFARFAKFTPDWNAASAVLAIEHNGRRLLLTGDANGRTWHEIIRHNPGPKIQGDAVVAWHHGAKLGSKAHNKTSDSVAWSIALGNQNETPRPVLISHGCANHFGHPHDETLRAIRRLGGEVYCTQLRQDGGPATPPKTAFKNAGYAFEYGCGTAPEYRRDGGTCCGDMTITITDDGNLMSDCQRATIAPPVSGVCCAGH